ncbi:hypothetical protein FISHEDRAFT_34238 [Fistulina hepatica ATCC 64428]|uniref:Uncharacterized protein n=1 Tax=Fistulina hepatica ATCC 64428 TaxID=1128425 RepID=A0A0D7ANS9_9AGAR|nr:hypothetical protein FISHEDRAFT_34238 [Fistulina hepatica ATCC 64428]
MTRYELQALDTVETVDYVEGELSDEELEIPAHLVPPNPDDTDDLTLLAVLPDNAHVSYPYGNPTSVKHPASFARPAFDPASRMLYEDMGYPSGGITSSIRWRDLALEELLPIDEAREAAEMQNQARKLASGVTSSNPPRGPPPTNEMELQDDTFDDDGEEGEDEEDDEDEREEDDEEGDGSEEDL